MNWFKICAIFFFEFFFLSACQKPQFKNINGKVVFQGNENTLLVFINTECPICQNYQGTYKTYLKAFDKTYFVFPGKQKMNEVLKFMSYDSIPKDNIVQDENFKLVQYSGATVTPQAVVIKNQKPVYSGKLDNRYKNIGDHPAPADTNYVMNILNLLKKNGSVPVQINTPVGCYIEPD